ncbi:hypothetical protein ACFLRY_04225 [Bacteroidota bacterium]
MPFRIYVNTADEKYEFSMPVFLKARYIQDEKPYLQLHILYYPVKLDLFGHTKMSLSFTSKETKSKKEKKKKGFSYKMIFPVWSFFVRIIKSFRIKQFDVVFDTDDFPLNAQLVPVLFHLSNQNVHLKVNFLNENYAIIDLKNNLFSFIRYGLPLYFKIRKIRKRRK